MFAAEALGGPSGRRLQGLRRAQPGVDEAFDLQCVPRVTVAAGIGSGGDLDPRGECPAQALDMVLPQMVGPFADMRQRRLAVEIVNRKGRHKEDAALRHRVEQFGLLVEVAAVLDRVDPGLDRNAQAPAAKGVTHDTAVERVRLVGQRLHVVQIEGAVPRPVLGARTGTARGRAFDDVRPGPHHSADHRSDIGKAVDEPVGQQRVVRHAAGKPGRADAVADPADRRDDAQRDDEPRP